MTIKEVRLKTGMSITQFSAAFNYPFEVQRDWENERKRVPQYIVDLIYEVCVYRNYIIEDPEAQTQKPEQKPEPVFNASSKTITKLLYRISQNTDNEFAEAFEADDFPRCHQLIDMQLSLHRLRADEALLLQNYINDISI